MFPQLDKRVDPKKWNVPSLVVPAQILNHQPVQREQIDVGITVDVLIHFHCIFGGDRTKRRINFCTKYKFLHRRRTFQGRPIQHSVTRRLCPRSGNDSCTCLPIQCSIRSKFGTLLILWLPCFVMVAMVMKLQGVLPPAVGKNVTVRNESLNQTTEAFSFYLQSNGDSSFDFTSFWPISRNVNSSMLRISPGQPVNNMDRLIGKREKG